MTETAFPKLCFPVRCPQCTTVHDHCVTPAYARDLVSCIQAAFAGLNVLDTSRVERKGHDG